MVQISTEYVGTMPVLVGTPQGEGPFPAVVVIHDALGMTTDLRHQVEWLAGEGFLAAAPDLYHWNGKLRCVVATVRDAARGTGRSFDDIEAVRRWLITRPDSSGSVGVIGFCMGGGFAIMLAPTGDYGAASVNYGGLPRNVEALLAGSCPMVASYGGLDRFLKGSADRLERVLTAHGIDHDITTYPEAGHSFLNDHAADEMPALFAVVGRLAHSGYHEPSASDARRRIVAFLRRHL